MRHHRARHSTAASATVNAPEARSPFFHMTRHTARIRFVIQSLRAGVLGRGHTQFREGRCHESMPAEVRAVRRDRFTVVPWRALWQRRLVANKVSGPRRGTWRLTFLVYGRTELGDDLREMEGLRAREELVGHRRVRPWHELRLPLASFAL